ncbi:Oxygen-independent coproporphyrinogen-III oxidase-like protein HemZ [Paenibacillus solanacearum]|uniref:Oxygen-independent coproporphyrinogen-III oxidase-like protein HemZ n=1 Tax=Paenibacillus solanacearum TaxID=2048548 RepID=A0A916K2A7_9BACL|nr:coproporphyrinogen III oxidase [Paenibacillus solanacearum]CAG7631557.1 Oxygen-independent coproporphyrinogen-III oxidase-like protein HemZ [Paenibacillus solanacearum]
MKIEFERVGFSEQATEMFHICKLFFEEVESVYEPSDDARLLIRVTVTADESARTIAAEVSMTDRETGAVHGSRHARAIEARDEGYRRAVKRTVGYCLLQVLQEYTGIEQAWGTLTGVRPTKLMHNLMMKHGIEHCKQVLRDENLVTEPKVELLSGIAERQLKVIPDLFRLEREVSIYIGIPFCPTKCAYCTFPAYDIRGNNGSVEAFLEGLHYEIREMGKWMREADVAVTTIYWGGGTPTSITAEQMDALFATMQESFPAMDRVRELTVEAGRPDTITEDKIHVMKKWNVDRISINPQSFTQATLDTIGRHHTVTETLDKFKLAREMGMNNINMDLIIGLPNEGMTELQRTLDQTAALLPESLTVHTLSFKRASRMTKNKDDYEVAERDEITEMIRTTSEWTERHGYVPYYMYRQKNILGNQENVGYSLEGYESLYNILMMEERQTIIGLGCGAVSKVLFPKVEHEDGYEQRIERFPNPKEPAVYNKAYKEYIEKKIRLLDEAYGRVATGQS